MNHPAGVMLPLEDLSAAVALPPELHCAIGDGSYASAMIARLPDMLCHGDRVAVIGSGLGILSTLVARCPNVRDVIVIEPDARVARFLNRVHALNGVPWVRTVNAVATGGQLGGVPVFGRQDPGTSSLLPEDGPWDLAMLVPCVDLELILADEEISAIVCDLPTSAVRMIAECDLAPATRVLVNLRDSRLHFWREGEPGFALKRQGFAATCLGPVVLMERKESPNRRA